MDWLRFSLPGALWTKAVEILREFFGDDCVDGAGLFNLPNGMRWAEAGVFYDRANDGYRVVSDNGERSYCIVELPGSALALLTDPEAWRVLAYRLMEFGGVCKRIDLAVDWLGGDAAGLISRIVRACRRGELTGARRYKPLSDEAGGGEFVGEGVYLGLRGKNGSGRFVRVYDKGLQTGTMGRGEWVRWEAECTHEVAAEVAGLLMHAENWSSLLCDIALGCVDFRAVNGAEHVARRPRSAWWARMLPRPEARIVRARKPLATARGYAKWVVKACLPVFAGVAAATGQSWGELAARLGWGGEIPNDLDNRQVVRELKRFFEDGPGCEAEGFVGIEGWDEWLCGGGFVPLPPRVVA